MRAGARVRVFNITSVGDSYGAQTPRAGFGGTFARAMATDARASSLAQVVDRLREVLFGMALVCVTQAPVLPQATVLGTVVEGAQMLAFALHRASPMPWDADEAVAPLSSVLDAFALQRADRTIGADSFRALMGIVLGWVALFAALAALVGWKYVQPLGITTASPHPRAARRRRPRPAVAPASSLFSLRNVCAARCAACRRTP